MRLVSLIACPLQNKLRASENHIRTDVNFSNPKSQLSWSYGSWSHCGPFVGADHIFACLASLVGGIVGCAERTENCRAFEKPQ